MVPRGGGVTGIAVFIGSILGGFLTLAIGVATYPGSPKTSDIAEGYAERRLASRRDGCCKSHPRPCPSCSDYQDGLDDMVEWIAFTERE